jgi:hypothetical protein
MAAAVDEMIPTEQWVVYRDVIHGARAKGIPFALAGAFAVGTYTGTWRNTKDLDLSIVPRDRDAMVEVMNAAGLADYYDQQPYDRGWIYRGYRDGTIVDIIWAMANRRAFFDEQWLTRAPEFEFMGERVNTMPAEELIWDKLYIVQRQRCDWPDILNLLHATASGLDWAHLLRRLGEDRWLFAGLLSVYRWMCPGAAAANIPAHVWRSVNLPAPAVNGCPRVDVARVNFFDTRPWFGVPRSEN